MSDLLLVVANRKLSLLVNICNHHNHGICIKMQRACTFEKNYLNELQDYQIVDLRYYLPSTINNMFDNSDSVFQFLILKQKKVFIFSTIPYQRVIKLEIVLLTHLMYLEKSSLALTYFCFDMFCLNEIDFTK